MVGPWSSGTHNMGIFRSLSYNIWVKLRPTNVQYKLHNKRFYDRGLSGLYYKHITIVMTIIKVTPQFRSHQLRFVISSHRGVIYCAHSTGIISYRLPVQVRTTLGGISLFNDGFQNMTWFLYATEKGGQRAKWRRDWERGRETEYCCRRVTAWAINLTVRTNIYDS